MIALFDVDYRTDGTAVAACVTVNGWGDAAPAAEYAMRINEVAAYQPGQFYKREMPCLLALIQTLPEPPNICVVDGYVWLGDETKPGLGGHLYTALGETIPVVGVAKTRFTGAKPVAEVTHGETATTRPLYVSAVGMPLSEAAKQVQAMHGTFRLPTLIKRVDTLCRTATP